MDEQQFRGIEVADDESVCPSCHLVYLTSVFSWGVCPDCMAEGIRALPI